MSSPNRIRIAYAFPPNKERAVIQQSLLDYANLHGVDFLRIDLQSPLHHQSPFDCIIHKVYDESWIDQLRQFSSMNPDVAVVEPPELIAPLLDRGSMLEAVKELRIPNVNIGAPKQVVLRESGDFDEFRDLGLKFPAIAKPLKVNGSAKSHEMCLLFNRSGLKELAPPIVLQEFVNHGGVLFKVYVVGEEAVCVQRKSLPDITETEEELERKVDVTMKFSLVSRSGNGDGENEDVEMPPLKIVTEVARGLREAMGLRLFNFDLIRDQNNAYSVIDINYLPGYTVLPNYEQILTRFFRNVAAGKKKTESEFKADSELQVSKGSNGGKFLAAINGRLVLILVWGIAVAVLLRKIF